MRAIIPAAQGTLEDALGHCVLYLFHYRDVSHKHLPYLNSTKPKEDEKEEREITYSFDPN